MGHLRLGLVAIFACAAVAGCTPKQDPATAPIEGDSKRARRLPAPVADAMDEPEVLEQPVAFWDQGRSEGQVDGAKAATEGYLLLDLGEEWTPYILTESSAPDEEPLPHEYRPTYLALARGEFPDDRHGYRAEKDQYLELYGILPTLTLLRTRFAEVRALECASELDLETLQSFDGFLAYDKGWGPKRRVNRYERFKPEMDALVATAQVESLEQITREQVADDEQWARVEEYRRIAPEYEAIVAAQARL